MLQNQPIIKYNLGRKLGPTEGMATNPVTQPFAVSVNRDFAFFVFERTKHQPRRNLRSYLVLQRLCNEAALSLIPALMHFGTRSWSKMVVRWRYADLSTAQSRKVCVTNAWSAYTTWLLMT